MKKVCSKMRKINPLFLGIIDHPVHIDDLKSLQNRPNLLSWSNCLTKCTQMQG